MASSKSWPILKNFIESKLYIKNAYNQFTIGFNNFVAVQVRLIEALADGGVLREVLYILATCGHEAELFIAHQAVIVHVKLFDKIFGDHERRHGSLIAIDKLLEGAKVNETLRVRLHRTKLEQKLLIQSYFVQN